MHRRSFLKSVGSLPVISSIPSVGKIRIENEEDSFWSLYSTWMQKSGNYEGQIKVWADGNLNRKWTYSEYHEWMDTVLLNIENMPCTSEMEFPVSLPFPAFKLSSVFIDPPYYSNLFYDHLKERPLVINDGKYSEYQHEARLDGDLIAQKDSLVQLLREVAKEL